MTSNLKRKYNWTHKDYERVQITAARSALTRHIVAQMLRHMQAGQNLYGISTRTDVPESTLRGWLRPNGPVNGSPKNLSKVLFGLGGSIIFPPIRKAN
jgi:hypothetical protein